MSSGIRFEAFTKVCTALQRLNLEISSGSLVSRTMFLLLCMLPQSVSVAQDDSRSMVEAAIATYNSAMEEQDRDRRLDLFARSQQLFDQVIEQQKGFASPELLVNRGNAAAQSEHLGEAILSYRQALELSPNHSQARQNLLFARSLLPSWARTNQDEALLDSIFFWRQFYSRQTITSIAALSFLIGCILIGVGIVRSSTVLRYLSSVPILIWLILLGSSYFQSNHAREAVVVLPETACYSADSENSPLRIPQPLPDGLEVEVVQIREEWTEIDFGGKTGWVRSAAIVRLE